MKCSEKKIPASKTQNPDYGTQTFGLLSKILKDRSLRSYECESRKREEKEKIAKKEKKKSK